MQLKSEPLRFQVALWLVPSLLLFACSSGETMSTDTLTTTTTTTPTTTTTTAGETTESTVDPTTEETSEGETTEGPTTDSTDSESDTDTGTDTDTTTTSMPECGNGMVEEGEACDDGNDDETDDCLSTCESASCGDGFVQTDVEECDDGNDVDTDECTNMCTTAVCGDGVTLEGVEECDDGNELDTDDCLTGCVLPTCGDGFIQEGVEECDDANMENTDECVDGCLLATCGDTYIYDGVEECDDGNAEAGDGCDELCQNEVAQTCNQLHMLDPEAPSGVYSIDPDGEGGADPFDAYCDMTTEDGGWTLILNRNVESDNNGQTDLNLANGTFDNTRASNWNYDIDIFWDLSTEVIFAGRENNDCDNCEISGYDSAILTPRPAAPAWSKTCATTSQAIAVKKIVGFMAGVEGTGYQCAASLGWGDCTDQVCHYGTHWQNTSSNGNWSQNQWTEMHFPSQYSSYASYGNVNNPPSAWCRTCAGGLAETLNNSTTCCGSQQFNARSRWTIWVR